MQQFPSGTLTLLFTDIEGSTRLLQQLGSQYAEVLAECRRLLRTAFAQGNGYEVDTQGDAFFVVFERAIDAIAAATAAQQALFSAHWPADVSVRVRMGLHTGEPQTVEEGYVGLDVHRAARIMSAAHGGQVLLSQATHDLVASALPAGLSLQDLGEYRLKDITGYSRLFQLAIPGLPTVFPSPSAPASLRSLLNTPTPSTSFVGREQEMVALNKQLRRADVRLLTLIGIAGVGKTRLALQLARSLAGQSVEQACFVALERVRNKDEAISAIAQALGVQEEPGNLLAEQILATLSKQSMLLVLDNFEHVLPLRLFLADLLARCADLKVLVTSRVMLHLQAEHLFEVSPLPLPVLEQQAQIHDLLYSAPVALFVQRAQAVLPDFQLTRENAADIVKICTHLDGIPLAIELAAAHLRHFSPANLLERLEQGTHFLRGKSLDIPERQQTLQEAIAWSYNLLEPAEQEVFRRIAICPGGVTLEAAAQICAAVSPIGGAIPEILENLVDKSMLQRQENGNGAIRFWQLQTLRDYGLECLSAAGELHATQAAFSAYMLSWVEQLSPLLTGAEQIFWLDQLDREYENVRVALEWLLNEPGKQPGRVEQGLRLCLALMRFWEIRCYFEEGASFLQQGLTATEGVSPIVKAQALYNAGFLALMQDEASLAETFLRESQALFRESGDRAAMADILRLQGNLALTNNAYKVARRLLGEALVIEQELGNARRAASACGALAQVIIAQGSYRKALSLLKENLASYQSLGDHYSTAYPLYYMARALFLSCQDQVRAQQLAEQSLALFRAVGNKRLAAHALDLLGQIHSAQCENEQANAALEESRTLFKEVGDRLGNAEALLSLARMATSQHQWPQARALYEESREILHALGARELMATCLEGYGSVLTNQGETLQAVQLWGNAAALRAMIVAPMPPAYRSNYIQAVNQARKHLGEDGFQAAWIEGSRALLHQHAFSAN